MDVFSKDILGENASPQFKILSSLKDDFPRASLFKLLHDKGKARSFKNIEGIDINNINSMMDILCVPKHSFSENEKVNLWKDFSVINYMPQKEKKEIVSNILENLNEYYINNYSGVKASPQKQQLESEMKRVAISAVGVLDAENAYQVLEENKKSIFNEPEKGNGISDLTKAVFDKLPESGFKASMAEKCLRYSKNDQEKEKFSEALFNLLCVSKDIYTKNVDLWKDFFVRDDMPQKEKKDIVSNVLKNLNEYYVKNYSNIEDLSQKQQLESEMKKVAISAVGVLDAENAYQVLEENKKSIFNEPEKGNGISDLTKAVFDKLPENGFKALMAEKCLNYSKNDEEKRKFAEALGYNVGEHWYNNADVVIEEQTQKIRDFHNQKDPDREER